MQGDATGRRLATTACTGRALASVIVLLAGCYENYVEVADVGVDVRADVDVVHDADADADGAGDARVDVDADVEGDVAGDADGEHGDDADTESDGDIDADVDACSGAWHDPTTGYVWENPPSETARTWDDSVAYCNSHALCGYPAGSWHMPTISELRSFVRGCPGMMTGGACGLTDSCLDHSCWMTAGCAGCSLWSGPGSGGCYWDPAVGGACEGHELYWSSSNAGLYSAWGIHFDDSYVGAVGKTYTGNVRCVHLGP